MASPGKLRRTNSNNYAREILEEIKETKARSPTQSPNASRYSTLLTESHKENVKDIADNNIRKLEPKKLFELPQNLPNEDHPFKAAIQGFVFSYLQPEDLVQVSRYYNHFSIFVSLHV